MAVWGEGGFRGLGVHRPVVAALALAAVLALLYPLVDERTRDPLAVFVLPVLFIAALGSRVETLIVGATATGAAVTLGVVGSLDGAGLAARMMIVVASWVLAVVVVDGRQRRDSRIALVESRMTSVNRAMHAGNIGTWEWNSVTGTVEWDEDLHHLFGLAHGEFEGTFDGWVARVHPDDRDRVLRELDRGIASGDVFRFDHRCTWPDGTIHWLNGVGEVMLGSRGSVLGAVGVTINVDERIRLLEIEKLAAERSRFLERTNRALIQSLDLGSVADRIASAAIEELADWCSLIVTVDHPVDTPFISVAHRDPDMVVWAKRLQIQYPYDPSAPTGVPQVLRSGVAEFVPTIDQELLDAVIVDVELRRIVENLELRSSIVVPIVGALGTLGALQLVRTSNRPAFTIADLQLATDLTGPIGSALNTTVLFARQQSAQRALEGLQNLTAQLADLTTVPEISTVIVESSAGLMRAPKCLLYLADSSNSYRLSAHTGYESSELEEWQTVAAAARAPIPDAVRLRTPIVSNSRAELEAQYPYVADIDSDDAAILTVPLIRKGEAIGALFVAWQESHVVTDADIDLLRSIAGRCTGALERARLSEQQRTIATTLQRSLLPAQLDAPNWFTATGHYWPGVAGTEVGGDFYDLFQITQDRWALTIGDVCGKGVEAAALTSVARHTARSAARHLDSPAEVLHRIHEALEAYDGESYCTVCFIFLDRQSSFVTANVALGGHPHPLLRRPDGQMELLGRAGSLLGFFPPQVFSTTTELGDGDVLALYTDGVTDAPGALAISVDELSREISGAGPGAVGTAAAIEELLIRRRPNGVSDDTAVMVIQIGLSDTC